MLYSNNQHPACPQALSIPVSSTLTNFPHSNSSGSLSIDKLSGIFNAESACISSKKLQGDLQVLGIKIKKHEDNVKFLTTQKNNLDESILDLQVTLGKYHSSSALMTNDGDHLHHRSEEETVEQILRHEKSAAGIICRLKTRHGPQASHLTLTKDVLGIVATLCKVDDDNLSRLFSEYLGLRTMLAIVCKTYEGVKALETYVEGGYINKASGLHGFGASIGRTLKGRFRAICLENISPYVGDFIANDTQKRLDLPKPRLQNGGCPPGFLGFAVNMLDLESTNLCYLTSGGYGLRETLLYQLFSHLQVYKTRRDMLLALPCISGGALSLDGGMIRGRGDFSLGEREDVDVRFSKGSGPSKLPANYSETEKKMRYLKWRKEKMLEDIKREQVLLDQAKLSFGATKEQLVKFIAESSNANQAA